MTEHIQYGHKGTAKLVQGYVDVFANPAAVRMCGREQVYKLKITERPDRPIDKKNYTQQQYIGWIDEKGTMCLVQPCWAMFSMQFAYGVEAAEKAGQGKAVSIDIEEIE